MEGMERRQLPAPAGHLMGRKLFPHTHRWLPLLLPLHPSSLLGTSLNQGHTEILSPGASLPCQEVQAECR